jgi:hypothetical protein
MEMRLTKIYSCASCIIVSPSLEYHSDILSFAFADPNPSGKFFAAHIEDIHSWTIFVYSFS